MDLAPWLERLRAQKKIRLTIKVVPRSSRTEFAGLLDDGTLRVKVAAVPDKGKANAELCGFLARSFGVPVRNVSIATGETSTLKRVDVVAVP